MRPTQNHHGQHERRITSRGRNYVFVEPVHPLPPPRSANCTIGLVDCVLQSLPLVSQHAVQMETSGSRNWPRLPDEKGRSQASRPLPCEQSTFSTGVMRCASLFSGPKIRELAILFPTGRCWPAPV